MQYESMTKKYVFEFQDHLDPITIESGDEDNKETAEKESNLLLKENMLR